MDKCMNAAGIKTARRNLAWRIERRPDQIGNLLGSVTSAP
jgi:hypothetical protein